ncbi:MAG: hypothetical protein Q7T97_04160 [Burkholderiaceae bacterium]|nr:hypothetical protein [Burkholderiaceae bacterium]
MRSILLIAAVAAMATSVHAQQGQDYTTHHPEGASAPAAAMKKAPPASKAQSSKARMAAPAASDMGMGGAMDTGQMKQMHEEMHKPGDMHDQMHGKDGKGSEGHMAMPPASAASRCVAHEPRARICALAVSAPLACFTWTADLA